MFYQSSVVASVLFYTVVCWGGSISKKDTSRLDKLIRRAGSVVGMKLDSLVTVAESRTLDKLLDIMDNASHPLHTVISNQRSLFSERLLLPKYLAVPDFIAASSWFPFACGIPRGGSSSVCGDLAWEPEGSLVQVCHGPVYMEVDRRENMQTPHKRAPADQWVRTQNIADTATSPSLYHLELTPTQISIPHGDGFTSVSPTQSVKKWKVP
ncbi:hypothetical protein L3Q82_004227 [Scortum barcoo]|uniref:Uncharacterized protein n=1 Tax=Scortum barcoo TaxID=214431 RepID=A0ACB8VJK0_9TELE|nr:hypothetical protein L3Q82_004227 [Scortum barcoo]